MNDKDSDVKYKRCKNIYSKFYLSKKLKKNIFLIEKINEYFI